MAFGPRRAREAAWRAGIALLMLAASMACRTPPAPRAFVASAWVEADALFHSDPRWLGADGAYSVALDDTRVLWLFGDTLVATSAANSRSDAAMIRNSIAVQTGRNPVNARIEFSWRTTPDGRPASFFAESGDLWHWPGAAVRIPGGPLVLFMSVVRASPGEGLGFRSAGWRVAIVSNPQEEPARWSMRGVDGPALPFDGTLASAAAIDDGGWVVALAPRNAGQHATSLARVRAESLARGDLDLEWWDGANWAPQAKLTREPAVVIDEANTEASLHRDAATGRWVFVTTRGFGATTIAMRTAARPEGPWSSVEDVYRPPESDEAGVLVYAAKAHSELVADGSEDLVATYAANASDFWTLFKPEGAHLYWPRFVRVRATAR